MKTSELIGKPLNWAVAKCVNPTYGMVRTHQDNKDSWHVTLHGETGNYAPSTNWAQGGPILERERIQFRSEQNIQYRAFIGLYGADATGPTHLIAAMRCYVASKLGDEVDVPEELS